MRVTLGEAAGRGIGRGEDSVAQDPRGDLIDGRVTKTQINVILKKLSKIEGP